MEKNKEIKINQKKSNLSLESRKKLVVSGVLEVLNFDEEKISLNTILGALQIKGSELKMNRLDVENGEVIIMGNIDAMIYSGNGVKKNKGNLLKRLFQ